MRSLPGLLTVALVPLLVVLADLLIWCLAALAVPQMDVTTGHVVVAACDRMEQVEIIVEAQPMPPVVEEDPSDNVHENSVTICVKEGE